VASGFLNVNWLKGKTHNSTSDNQYWEDLSHMGHICDQEGHKLWILELTACDPIDIFKIRIPFIYLSIILQLLTGYRQLWIIDNFKLKTACPWLKPNLHSLFLFTFQCYCFSPERGGVFYASPLERIRILISTYKVS
jgi:hypothetical protein